MSLELVAPVAAAAMAMAMAATKASKAQGRGQRWTTYPRCSPAASAVPAGRCLSPTWACVPSAPCWACKDCSGARRLPLRLHLALVLVPVLPVVLGL